MKYKGRELSYERGHIKIVEEDGSEWRADTIKEAKKDIDEEDEKSD